MLKSTEAVTADSMFLRIGTREKWNILISRRGDLRGKFYNKSEPKNTLLNGYPQIFFSPKLLTAPATV
jgi:hypothetical protein